MRGSSERAPRPVRADRRRVRLWRAYALAGVLASTGVLVLPIGLVRDAVYLVIGASGVVAILVGVRRHRPSSHRAWYLLAAGCAAWVAGDALYSWYEHVAGASPFPSFADVFYLTAYPLLSGGLLQLVRSRNPGRRPTALLDSAILTVGLGLISWVFLIVPTWSAGAAPFFDRVVGVAYPLGDVLLLAVLIRLCTEPGGWNGASRLFVASFVVVVVTDSLFEAGQLVPALASLGPFLDPGWLVFYVLCGAAALHPSMGRLSVPGPVREDTMLPGRVVVLAAAALAGPAVLAYKLVVGGPLHAWPAVICAGVVIILVLVRMARMVRQLQEQSRRLGRLSGTDYVTGLANRRRFAEHLDELLESPGADAVLLLLAVERFAEINATLGYRTGDEILTLIGRRLLEVTDADAQIARMDGDAFAVLVSRSAFGLDADVGAIRLRDAVEGSYGRADLSVTIEVAIGVLRVPTDSATSALALHRADIALSQAKTRPGRIARYGAEMDPAGGVSTSLIGELRGALDRSELILHYQPQTTTQTGRVFGVEALVRWQHPVHGLLGPDTFIPAAEHSGLIGPLTQYVLDEALRQCAAWRSEGLHVSVAVNLSVRNLLDPGLVDHVRAALDRHDLPAGALELEITEGTAMVDPRRSMQVLGALSAMGIILSIDDYGTGHSSLAYLQRLPVRRLKIDRSFVTGLLHDRASAAIVGSTIELARKLDLDVIAEGVEDDATLLALRDMGCFAVQGFGIGRPIDARSIPGLISSIHRRLPQVLGAGVAQQSSPARLRT